MANLCPWYRQLYSDNVDFNSPGKAWEEILLETNLFTLILIMIGMFFSALFSVFLIVGALRFFRRLQSEPLSPDGVTDKPSPKKPTLKEEITFACTLIFWLMFAIGFISLLTVFIKMHS